MSSEAGGLEAEILDLTHDGRGIADLSGQRVFVPGALPTEHVLIAPRKRRRRYQEADLLQVVAPAGSRVAAACEYFGRCGGCALQHMAPEAQLEFKQNVVEQAFARIAHAAPDAWLAPVVSPLWGYRRRARLGVKFVAAKRRVLVGFHERAATYITEMAHCPILMPPMNALLGELADAIARSSLRERLPQIEVAVGDDSAALVLRVLAPPTADDRQLFLELGRRHAIDIYVQPGGPGTVAPLAGETRPLRYGLPEFGVTLEFSPTDFVQINAHVNARLVSAAVEAADLRTGDRVLDLFCGLGNFSLPFARHAEIVLGVEGDAGLVARAVRNAALNGIRNARFLAADLAESEWSFLRESWDVVVIDPPRTGAEAVIAQMVDVEPRKIVYVSCHPATLARDAKLLADRHSYRLLSARVFDMFPHTHHVEVMAVFGRG